LTSAHLIALLALVVALGGTGIAGYAAGKAGGDSLIKKHSLSGDRLRSDSVKGAQVDESSLTEVKEAGHAATADQAVSAGSAASAPAGTLVPFAFGLGWSDDVSDTTLVGGYRKDAMGFVHLQGLVLRTGMSGNPVITTLPPGFRPSGSSRFPTVGLTGAPSSVRIETDGTVQLDTPAPDSTIVSLDPITFHAG
jgi:hypothetical protein